MILHHLTLTTGDLRESPRSEVGPEAIGFLKPLLSIPLGQRFPVPGVPKLWISCLGRKPGESCFDIGTGDETVVIMGVAWGESAKSVAWETVLNMCREYAKHTGTQISPILQKPPMPWCAAMITPAIAKLSRDTIGILGDLERCIAWTLIEHSTRKNS